MKKQFFIFITIIAFLTVCTAAIVPAQSSGKTLRMNVGFDFHVGKTLCPAGEYVIESVSPTSDNILIIRSADNRVNQMIIGNMSNAGKHQRPKIVFQRYGKSFFLSQVFPAGGQWGFSLRPPRKYREYLASAAEKVEVPLFR